MGPETNAVDIEHKGFYILSGQCKKYCLAEKFGNQPLVIPLVCYL